MAIMVMVAAIFIPILTSIKARNQRVLCGTNLRHLGTATSLYAVSNDRALPTHFSRRTISFDTFAMRNDDGQRVNLGLLVDHVPSASAFYCPTQSEDTSPSIAFDGARNRWRFSLRNGNTGSGGSVIHGAGAGSRPSGQGRRDEGGRSGPGDGADEHVGAVNSSYAARTRLRRVLGLPRWTVLNYRNKVIYSDFIGVDGWAGTGPLAGPIRAPHGGHGYNRLFGDDSVQWANADTVNASRPIDATAPTGDELHEYYQLLDVLP